MKIIAIISIIQSISASRYWRDPISAGNQIYKADDYTPYLVI